MSTATLSASPRDRIRAVKQEIENERLMREHGGEVNTEHENDHLNGVHTYKRDDGARVYIDATGTTGLYEVQVYIGGRHYSARIRRQKLRHGTFWTALMPGRPQHWESRVAAAEQVADHFVKLDCEKLRQAGLIAERNAILARKMIKSGASIANLAQAKHAV